MTTERPNIPKSLHQPVEPAEPDPGPGWLRSRFMGFPWPREGVAACGRRECPVCGSANRVSEKPDYAPIKPERSECREQAPAVQVLPQITGDDTIQTEEAIQHLRRYFHIYEGWSYYTLRCEICQQMFGIKPNVPILERSSFDMLMNHAKAHNKLPARPLDYSRRHPPSKGAVCSLEAQDEPYDATDDLAGSIDEAYAAVRARVAAGGPPWRPK